MKVIALGYGKVGFRAIELLAQSDVVTQIAVVGRDLERAERAAAEIGGKAIAVHADGADEQQMASLLPGYDIIMNAAQRGTVIPTMRAAIRTGTHYCDVAHGEAVEQALQLAAEAEGAGITSIVGNGIAPGIINLMAVHVARQLDEVEQLQNGRAGMISFQSVRELTPRQWLRDPNESLAAIYEFRRFIAMMLGGLEKNGIRTVLDHQDGQWVETDPVRSGVQVPLPQGGTATSYPYASGNPLWGCLPSELSRVPPVEAWFSPLPQQLHDLLRERALEVLEGTTDPETAVDSFYGAVQKDPHRWLTRPDEHVTIPYEWVRAVGRKGGRAARCSCWLAAPVWHVGGWFLTSAALAAAVRMILRGEIRERGAMTAETAFGPLPFLNEVAALMPDPPADGRLIDESFEWLE